MLEVIDAVREPVIKNSSSKNQTSSCCIIILCHNRVIIVVSIALSAVCDNVISLRIASFMVVILPDNTAVKSLFSMISPTNKLIS